MVERISYSHFKSFSPLLEFFSVRSIACDVTLLYTVRTHLAPLIVITAQPYLCDGVKLAVLIDFLRIDVAVIVNDWHLVCVIMDDENADYYLENFRSIAVAE